MARDYRAIEAEFIDDLKSRSGKSLSEWMAAIDATGLLGRDQIIDWLHPQGFTFSHASWLERIHNNGGQPIYRDLPPDKRPEPRRKPSSPTQSRAPAQPFRPRLVSSSPPPASAPVSADADALASILAKGKAYRMLAEMLIGEAKRAIPGVATTVHGEIIGFEHPGLFAALAVTARELRLGMALGERAVVAPLVKAKGVGQSAAITHMIVLNDARQVDDALVGWMKLANATVNGAPPNH
jgi:hypothetical protein